MPCGLAALLEVSEEGIPGGVGLGLPELFPGHPTRLFRRPGLLGDVDLDDLTAAHQLRNGLTRQANGVVSRHGFDPARLRGSQPSGVSGRRHGEVRLGHQWPDLA
jgi:hypothetical protein